MGATLSGLNSLELSQWLWNELLLEARMPSIIALRVPFLTLFRIIPIRKVSEGRQDLHLKLFLSQWKKIKSSEFVIAFTVVWDQEYTWWIWGDLWGTWECSLCH